MFELQKKKLSDLKPILNAVGDENLWSEAKFLYQRLSNPDYYIVFIGETSSGKSSIINGILDDEILPMSAIPTTGAITEIKLKEIVDPEYIAFTKEAKAFKISNKEKFETLAKKPTSEIKRLQVSYPSNKVNLCEGVSLFDTPGYNSIIEDHEEVLKDFLPNADGVVYVVSHKIGIQNEDYAFLRYLKELIREDVPVFLVVNRCPEGVDNDSSRVKEIRKYATDILGFEPQIHIVYNAIVEEGHKRALPKSVSLIEDINSTLSSEKRIEQLEKAFDSYINEIFEKCEKVLKLRLAASQTDEDTYQKLVKESRESSARLYKAIPDLIDPTFAKLADKIPEKINIVEENVASSISERLCNVSKFDKDEEVNYVNIFLLPDTIKNNTKEEVQEYIYHELMNLNNKVDDYIQQELIKFNSNISIQIETALEVSSQGIIKKYAGKVITEGIGRYVTQFGGQGGVNAGIANAASHYLKRAGDLFGKTFSRETHNALKHYMAKVGATSLKAVGVAVAVIMELGFMIYDITTWKKKVKKQVNKALSKWKEETEKSVIKDLEKLKEENINNVKQIADQILHTFDDEKPQNYEECKKDSELCDDWREKYKVEF